MINFPKIFIFSEKYKLLDALLLNMQDEITVGTKGEILPKKKMREAAGIHPGDRVTISISPGQIHIRKILTVDEALSLPIIKKATVEEFERMVANEEKEIMENL